jgi:hypothetical protein
MWHVARAIGLEFVIDLHQKLGNTIADMIRQNAATETSAAAIDAMIKPN